MLGVVFIPKMSRKCLFQFKGKSFAALIYLKIEQNLVFIKKIS